MDDKKKTLLNFKQRGTVSRNFKGWLFSKNEKLYNYGSTFNDENFVRLADDEQKGDWERETDRDFVIRLWNFPFMFIVTLIYTSSGAKLPRAGVVGSCFTIVSFILFSSSLSFIWASNALIRFSCLTITAFSLRISSWISFRSACCDLIWLN